MRRLIVIAITVVFCQCDKKESVYVKIHEEFVTDVLKDNGRFYDLDKRDNYHDFALPIGVFDSGIGGLSVFDAILNADNFDNYNKRISDSVRDFKYESFIYLADQANMPYSNYVEVGNTALLEEHILKDFLFLLNTRYNLPECADSFGIKPSVKTVVIACNTATAYGKTFLEDFIEHAGIKIKIIGVIDAGAMGALEVIGKRENGTIAIFATPATVNSHAYVNAITEMIGKNNYIGNIQIVQQGGKGLHESIDNKEDFIGDAYVKPYQSYQGPSYTSFDYKIEKDLLDIYNFDTLHHNVLYNSQYTFQADSFQINSIENYVRYHIVSIVEKIKMMRERQPLKAIVLGCTHYPFVESEIKQVLSELKMNKRYKDILTDEVVLIDPAENTAIELYKHLSAENLLNTVRHPAIDDMFFTSVPNTFNQTVELNESRSFTYEYQYLKREKNELKPSTLIVPISEKVISKIQLNQIREKYPETYNLIRKANHANQGLESN